MGHKVISDFGQGSDPTSLTVTPYWIICIFRQKNPVSYKRSSGTSFSEDITKGLELFGIPLIITDDCFQLSVQSTKSNHITTLNAGLYPGENYLQLINPGDWMCAWMVQNETTFRDLMDRIKDGKPCNGFQDGLKFFGKVGNIRKQLQQDANGPRKARYVLTGTSFSEFDATLYYNPYLVAKQDALATQFGRFGYDINQLIDLEGGGITADKAIPQMVDVLLGKGTPSNLAFEDGPKTTYGTEGEYAYILPVELGQIIGKTITTKSGGIGYSDIVELVIGIQTYGQQEVQEPDDNPTQEKTGLQKVFEYIDISKTFQPKGTESSGSRRFTDSPKMLGSFLPTVPAFTDKTVWNVLREFLNPACNEMYTTLRVNPDGHVVPTLIVRQLPFTTDIANLSIANTQFSNLPRWELHPILLRNADIGRSDAMRWNFVEVLPISSSGDARNLASLSSTFPPRFDAMDIARNGLRPYNITIPCFAGDMHNDSTKNWKDLINDILMGQHMTLTGTLTSVGIQSPICIGDNIEFDGVVYHIENLSHTCAITESGQKSFNTHIGLTNGVNEDQSGTDESIYAYTSDFDTQFDEFDPGINTDSTITRDKHETRTSRTEDPNDAPINEGAGTNPGFEGHNK